MILFILLVFGLDSNTKQSFLLSFADSLYSVEDYFASATEYERFLYYFPTDSNSDYARLKLCLSYLKANEPTKAEKTFGELEKTFSSYSRNAQLALAKYYIQSNNYYRAKTELQDLLLTSSDSNEVQKLNRLLGRIALAEFDFQQAENYFTLSSDSIALKEIQNLKRLPRKSPMLASILSTILPGTGEIYSGHYWTGIGAFLVNGLSIAGIVYSVNKKNYIDATLIFSIFFSRFYLGSRQNAFDFANKSNEDLFRRRMKILIDSFN
jgi:tetratricopeptide (TPR) repeat protein